jgi:ubiquinone/menaquinone biosynthesis C-methylase UbiE
MTEQAQNQFSDGAAYERMMGRWSRKVGSQFIDWLDAGPGLDWLDAGCGNGAFTEEIQALTSPRRVAGLDPSPQQIDYARRRPNLSAVHFEVGDAQNLPFDSQSFDAAVMALVIAFIPDPARAVSELRRVVRPGGLVATYMWDLPAHGVPLRPVYEALTDMGHGPAMPPRADMSRSEALGAAWTAGGLQDVEQTVLHITVSYDGFADFWESNSAPTGPQGKFIESLTPEKRDELRQRLQDKLPPAADGRISYGSFANAVKGRVPLG